MAPGSFPNGWNGSKRVHFSHSLGVILFREAGFTFKMEYIFPDLRSPNGRPLRFDLVVFDDDGNIDFLIEYQGIQHYQPKSKFGGMAGLRTQQYYDMLKREYCKKHNIPLVLIPYYDEGRINYDYIFKAAGY